MSPGGNISRYVFIFYLLSLSIHYLFLFRIGLPEYDWGANCIHGVQSRCGTKCPTSFSNPIGLAARSVLPLTSFLLRHLPFIYHHLLLILNQMCSFNMSIVRQMGAIIGLELRSLWLQGVGENHPNNLPHLVCKSGEGSGGRRKFRGERRTRTHLYFRD